VKAAPLLSRTVCRKAFDAPLANVRSDGVAVPGPGAWRRNSIESKIDVAVDLAHAIEARRRVG